jgi:mannose-1-phosphate guanylyltransferase/mannose-6-phosphate isomerase
MPVPPPLVPVILSGGAGSRLWPVSRETAPKAFMRLPDGETLLAKTAARALSLPDVVEVITVTDRELYFQTKDLYASVERSKSVKASFILEPFGRNTAPAVALAAMVALARHGRDVVLLVLPADHLIADEGAFTRAVARATSLARGDMLVTFGIEPTRPETGFGYLECGAALEGILDEPFAYRARRFVEKPDEDVARALIATGSVWNSGMFCFTASAILGAFARHAKDLLDAVQRCPGPIASLDSAMLEIDPDLFAAVPSVSLDYALMEPAAVAGEVAIVRATFDWTDVGSWQAVAELVPADAQGNRGQGEHIAIATHNTYVHGGGGGRVIATVGVENLAIVDTEDALLVAHRDALQRVGEVIAELKARGHDAYRTPRTVTRPWGAYTILHEGPGFKVKRIEIKPGAAMSLQLHHHRSEHWVVVEGTAHVTHGDVQHVVDPQGFVTVLADEKHRLENRGDRTIVIVEVQCGDYLGEDDIVRFEDRYGRAE